MTTWPNWVDLIVITTVFIGCYNGFGRGFLAEFLHLIGAVSITALTVNYWRLLAVYLQPWVPLLSEPMGSFLFFWSVFALLWVAARVIIRRLTDVVKWERLHWSIQGIGLILGALRGLWWSGLILITLSSMGFEYLRQSVEERSVSGLRMLARSRQHMEWVTNQFPGAEHRGSNALVPPARSGGKAPSKKDGIDS